MDSRSRRTRLAAAGGIVGPAAFIAAWAILGRRVPGYSAVDDAISRLAATGAPDRATMTAGFVAFGTGVPLYGLALRATLPGPAWVCATTAGVATLGVAAFPLGATRDDIHGLFAGLAYAGVAATPLAAARPLERAGRRHWARSAVGAGIVSGACLLATLLGPASGFFQRAGLTAADAWIMASAVDIFRRHVPSHWAPGRPAP